MGGGLPWVSGHDVDRQSMADFVYDSTSGRVGTSEPRNQVKSRRLYISRIGIE